MIVRTHRTGYFIRMSLIAVCLMAAYSSVAASQETKNEAALSPCPSAADKEDVPEAPVPKATNLTGVPQAQGPSRPFSPSSHPQDGNSAILFLPVATPKRLTFGDKFTIYAHQTFGPPALIFPAFAAGIGIANPRSHYPREWKDGAGAFGRLYGDSIAMSSSQRTARFLAGAALHEDPRYVRSKSTNPLMRTTHALAFTFIDKTDSGRNTIAFSNFAGAAAGSFVGSAYLPNGFNDLSHAEQRMAIQFTSIAIQNIAAEFQPQWGPIVRKLHIQKIIPEWWVPQHKN